MCVTSALEPRFFRHSLMSDSSCPISSFPCAKNIFIGICSPFPTGGRPDRPSEWLSAEVAILGLASLQDATSSISVRSSSGAHGTVHSLSLSSGDVFITSSWPSSSSGTKPRPPHLGHCSSSSVPFSTTPSPLQSGQVSMCAPNGDATTPPRLISAGALLIRQWQRRSGKSSPDEFVTFWKNGRRVLAACPWPV